VCALRSPIRQNAHLLVTGDALGAVEDDRRVVADATAPHQLLELGLLDDVALDGVLEVVLPVQLDRTGDVALLVEVGVLVHLRDDDAAVSQALDKPIGRHEHVLRVVLE
jgi:hypothetical protein